MFTPVGTDVDEYSDAHVRCNTAHVRTTTGTAKAMTTRAPSTGEDYNGYCKGHDYTRAFLSADFAKDATDDLSDLLPGDAAARCQHCLPCHSRLHHTR